jgi:uncharacterized glyoxalase superfamily protein PhnB
MAAIAISPRLSYRFSMLRNRSVPADTVLPHIRYRNLAEAIVWLCEKFGFREHYRYGDPLSGSQLHLGDAWVMVTAAPAEYRTPTELGYWEQMLTIFVMDVDAHFAQAKAAGVTIVEELHETIYGERQYGAEDLEGRRWLFSQHARNASPDEWGARLAEPSPF